MKIELNLAGDDRQLDTLYAACAYYAMKQAQIAANAVIPEERDLSLVRLDHIKSILKQIELLPANPDQ